MQMHGYEHAANTQQLTSTSTDSLSQVIQHEQTKQSHWNETISITIPAKGAKEYKFQVGKNAILNYTWKTDKGELFFDLHGEPQGDTTGYFKTFEKDTKAHASGSLTTIFTGTHGWYWKNSHAFPVVITLKVSGEYQRLDLQTSQDNKPKTPLTHDSID